MSALSSRSFLSRRGQRIHGRRYVKVLCRSPDLTVSSNRSSADGVWQSLRTVLEATVLGFSLEYLDFRWKMRLRAVMTLSLRFAGVMCTVTSLSEWPYPVCMCLV